MENGTGMSEHEAEPAEAPAPRRSIEETAETKFPRGLVVRLFAYLVAGHIFAGFLYLLFEVGGK
ncbi:hypothetical protein GCM10010331_35230 [Streptomyces xanthochromogenes]|uniref:Small hydrophobic protein n=2 Tax=Streptomyces TaxID=1883 RepID=A0ABQ3A4Y2_9ACTN|nr:hypothetical protein [Streptomyces sp. SID1034]GGY36150.1 hypothetical protein GCM10010326_32550 [Streptomyces xanthochromogenes]GHB44880.1 hypothetical protein GCM10010331_35230 [Streptomyces xanthochromogenes]